MRRDREEFLAFFGTDELVLPILEAEGRLNAYYKVRRDSALAARGLHRAVSESGETTFVMPEGSSSSTPWGSSTMSSTGSRWCRSTGCCASCSPTRRWPATASTPTCSAPTCARTRSRRCRCAGWRPPSPLNVDAAFQRVLGNRNFRWDQNGAGLLRKRKPGHDESEPTPGVAVLSDRVWRCHEAQR